MHTYIKQPHKFWEGASKPRSKLISSIYSYRKPKFILQLVLEGTLVVLVYISSQRHIQKRVINKMSTFDTKLDSLCDNLEGCNLDGTAETKISDEELFKQPPAEDCSICFLRMPTLDTGWRYQSCCGKVICNGCIYSPVYDNQGNEVDKHKCPFCRTPTPTSYEEMIERLKKREHLDDPFAVFHIGTTILVLTRRA